MSILPSGYSILTLLKKCHAGALTGFCSRVVGTNQGANVTWSGAGNVSADADVSLEGTRVRAVNMTPMARLSMWISLHPRSLRLCRRTRGF